MAPMRRANYGSSHQELAMKKILPGLTVLFTLVASAGIAAADAKCENVKITITNQFSKNNDHKNIKIVDLDYWDAEDGKWREEVTGNENVGYGDAQGAAVSCRAYGVLQ
jgi:hypothetical protein